MPKRPLLPLAVAAAVTMSLIVAGCTQGDATGTEVSATLPVYTPSAGSGDPVPSGAGSASADGSTGTATGMTQPPGAAGAGTASATAAGPSGTALGTASTGVGPTSGVSGSTITVMPTRATVTLASSLEVSMTVAPGVDTSGVDIEGAKKAYYGFLAVGDRAVADPTQDWRSEFAKYAIDPVLSAVVSEIEGMSSRGVRSVGHSAFYALTTYARPNEIALRVCNDVSGVDRVNSSDGASVGSDSGDRHPQDVTITRDASKHWYVKVIIPHLEVTC